MCVHTQVIGSQFMLKEDSQEAGLWRRRREGGTRKCLTAAVSPLFIFMCQVGARRGRGANLLNSARRMAAGPAFRTELSEKPPTTVRLRDIRIVITLRVFVDTADKPKAENLNKSIVQISFYKMTLGANRKPAGKIYRLTSVNKYPPSHVRKGLIVIGKLIWKKHTELYENRI